MSPSASCRAFLQSIIPAPVCLRSAWTSFALIVASAIGGLLLGGGVGVRGAGGVVGRVGELRGGLQLGPVLARRRGVGRRRAVAGRGRRLAGPAEAVAG